MNINEILELWDADAIIDDNHLNRESLYIPVLHAKYLRLLLDAKKKLAVGTTTQQEVIETFGAPNITTKGTGAVVEVWTYEKVSRRRWFV